ncbi:MAG: glycoside hydrolase family 3 N-terminal domain-containing protein [Calditrichia bacterium]
MPSMAAPELSEAEIQENVAGLISQMTIEEKAGQMTQLTIEEVAAQRGYVNSPFKLDEKRLEEILVNHHVGSLLNVYDAALTVKEWHSLIKKIQDIATKKTRLKIPVLYGIDAIHGANYTREATLFPQSIAMAATWNPELVFREGEITAREVRAVGIPWNFNPVLGVGRHPLWPRFWETYGEDTYLVSEMGKAYVNGLEGIDNNVYLNEKVAACIKHYLGYSFPLSGKDRTPAWIPERMLREIFLPPFAEAVKAGALTVMVNSGEINGIPVHADPILLTELLRNELGFQGMVVTDWSDIENLWVRDRVAADGRAAVKMAINAGIDMCMVPLGLEFTENLIDLIKTGEIPMSRVDEAVGRILYLKYRLGLFENPYPPKDGEALVGTPEAHQSSLMAAREAITLLKNTDILPLKPDTRILVAGPTANLRSVMNGGWSYTWQGNEEALYPEYHQTLLGALQKLAGEKNVTYQPGASYDKLQNLNAAVAAAKKADVVVLALGEMPYCETPGNIDDLNLPEAQLELARALYRTGKPVVLVLVEGRPRIIRQIADDAAAIVMGYLPGPYGAQAIGEVLFGKINPSGKLPFTYPRYPNDLMTYDHKFSEEYRDNKFNPQFEFGFGLSYTRFKYGNIKLNRTTIRPGEELEVSVEVTNVGKLPGKEVVLLYLTDQVRSVSPPVKQLKRFRKIELQPGESQVVKFKLNVNDLSFIGRENRRVTEAGEFEITIANKRARFVLHR